MPLVDTSRGAPALKCLQVSGCSFTLYCLYCPLGRKKELAKTTLRGDTTTVFACDISIPTPRLAATRSRLGKAASACTLRADHLAGPPSHSHLSCSSDRMKSGSVLLAGLCVIAAAAVGRVRMQIARHPRSSLEHTADLWDTAGRNSSKYQITRVASDSTTAQVTCMPEAIGAMPGKSCSPPYHIHTFQRETFVVHKGTFTFLVDGRQTTLQAGAAPFIVESPVPHSWWNAEPGQEGMLEFSFTPGGKIREFFRTIMGLGQDWGNVGLVTPFQLLSTFHAADYVPADIPTPVWKVLSWCMPALEWTLGIQPFYSEYTDAQKL